MNKTDIFFLAGFLALLVGCTVIHYGLGLAVCGVYLILCGIGQAKQEPDEETDFPMKENELKKDIEQ